MSNPILEGMARVVHAEFDPTVPYGHMSEDYRRGQENVMRAALLWLAEQYEKDWLLDYSIFVPTEHPDGGINWEISHHIAAALRQAAGGGE